MYKCFTMVVSAIICEKGVGKPTQPCLILMTLVSNVDDSCFCKACKLTSL